MTPFAISTNKQKKLSMLTYKVDKFTKETFIWKFFENIIFNIPILKKQRNVQLGQMECDCQINTVHVKA